MVQNKHKMHQYKHDFTKFSVILKKIYPKLVVHSNIGEA